MTAVATELRTPLPPIVLEQQRAIDAALELAGTWDKEARRLQEIADYTRVHGTNLLADRYAVRGRAMTANAQALRCSLAIEGDGHQCEDTSLVLIDRGIRK